MQIKSAVKVFLITFLFCFLTQLTIQSIYFLTIGESASTISAYISWLCWANFIASSGVFVFFYLPLFLILRPNSSIWELKILCPLLSIAAFIFFGAFYLAGGDGFKMFLTVSAFMHCSVVGIFMAVFVHRENNQHLKSAKILNASNSKQVLFCISVLWLVVLGLFVFLIQQVRQNGRFGVYEIDHATVVMQSINPNDKTPPVIKMDKVEKNSDVASWQVVTNEWLKKAKIQYRIIGTDEWSEKLFVLNGANNFQFSITNLNTNKRYEYRYELEDLNDNRLITDWKKLPQKAQNTANKGTKGTATPNTQGGSPPKEGHTLS